MMRKKSLFNQLFHLPYFKHNLPTDPIPNVVNRILDTIIWITLEENSRNNGEIQRLMVDDGNYFINARGNHSFHIETMSKCYKIIENFTSSSRSTTLNIHGNTVQFE